MINFSPTPLKLSKYFFPHNNLFLCQSTTFGDLMFLLCFFFFFFFFQTTFLLHLLLLSLPRLGDLLFLLCFLLLLHHPDCCRVMYCYSTFLFHYYSFYYSSTHFYLLDFLEMPWSNFMKPCRNIICHVKLCCLRVDFFKMAAVDMETAKMLKKSKTQKWS